VLIPKVGPTGSHFFTWAVQVQNLVNVTIQVDGMWRLNKNYTYWKNDLADYMAGLYILNSNGITLTGSGLIDGQGYDWWWCVLLLFCFFFFVIFVYL
jgi:hypothetical protein